MPESTTFHEIEESIVALLEAQAEAENPDDPEYREALMQALAQLKDQEAEKADAIAYVLGKMEVMAEHMKATADAISRRREAKMKQIARLREYVFAVMQNNGIAQIKGLSATFYTVKSKRVDVYDDSAIPPDFMKVSVTVDKAGVGRALKAGQEVPGARLEESLSLGIRR